MIALLPALLFFTQTAPPAEAPMQSARVFATIDHSEWCPAGNFELDLATGDYALTRGAARGACQDPKLVRPVQHGRLDAARLSGVRLAFGRAMAGNLDACFNGGSEEIIVSNGGTPIMVLTNGAGTKAAPGRYGCWNADALALRRALADAFASVPPR
jgi:hypothetical protein